MLLGVLRRLPRQNEIHDSLMGNCGFLTHPSKELGLEGVRLILFLSSPGNLDAVCIAERGISYAYCVRRRSGLSCLGRLCSRLPSEPGRAPAALAPAPTPSPAKAAENAERED